MAETPYIPNLNVHLQINAVIHLDESRNFDFQRTELLV